MSVKRFGVGALCAVAAFFVGGACNAVHAEPPMLQRPTPIVRPAGTLRVESPVSEAGTVYLHWTGTIAEPMHDRIRQAFEAFKSSRTRFVLVLHSGGGSVTEGEKVITLLQRVRQSHRFDTMVRNGAACGSMCIPVYMQGDRRYGARASTWLFHEVTRSGSQPTARRKVEGRYDELLRVHGVPMGLSATWLDRIIPQTIGHDVWQTGQELLSDGSGIITDPIEARTRRKLEPTEPPAQAQSSIGSGSEGGAVPARK